MFKKILLPFLSLTLIGCSNNFQGEWKKLEENQYLAVYVGDSQTFTFSYESFPINYYSLKYNISMSNSIYKIKVQINTIYTNVKDQLIEFAGTNISYKLVTYTE